MFDAIPRPEDMSSVTYDSALVDGKSALRKLVKLWLSCDKSVYTRYGRDCLPAFSSFEEPGEDCIRCMWIYEPGF